MHIIKSNVLILAFIIIITGEAQGGYRTPGASWAYVIRPWPELGIRPESKEALEGWHYSVTLLINDAIDCNPEVTITNVLDAYRDGAGAIVDFPWFSRHLKVMVRGAFKRLGTYSADMAMPTLRIIKQLDVIKQVCSCFFSGRIDPSAYSLHF